MVGASVFAYFCPGRVAAIGKNESPGWAKQKPSEHSISSQGADKPRHHGNRRTVGPRYRSTQPTPIRQGHHSPGIGHLKPNLPPHATIMIHGTPIPSSTSRNSAPKIVPSRQ